MIFVCLVLFIINTSYANTLDDIIKITEEAFDVRVITDTSTLEKSWEEISYNPPTDTSHLLIYLVLLNAELNKYPENYISNAGVKKMVLCSNLYYKDQNRATIPDPYNNTLYFAIDSFYETEYLIHVIHHELHHVTEYAIWEDMYYNWKKWKRKNKVRFKYGEGGSSAYENNDTTINWRAINNPEKGFVNLYSTLGQEEDRCEIVALLMKSDNPEELIALCNNDKRLRKKVTLIIQLLDDFIGDTMWTPYWKSGEKHFRKKKV